MQTLKELANLNIKSNYRSTELVEDVRKIASDKKNLNKVFCFALAKQLSKSNNSTYFSELMKTKKINAEVIVIDSENDKVSDVTLQAQIDALKASCVKITKKNNANIALIRVF